MDKSLIYLFVERALYSVRDHGNLSRLWPYVKMKGAPKNLVQKLIHSKLSKIKKIGISVRELPPREQPKVITYWAKKIARECYRKLRVKRTNEELYV